MKSRSSRRRVHIVRSAVVGLNAHSESVGSAFRRICIDALYRYAVHHTY